MTTYTKFGAFVDNSITHPINAAFLNSVETALATYTGAGVVLAGTGIDLTGATVSTSAVQTFLNNLTDGTTVVIPDNAVINLDATITVGHRLRFTGTGELRWTAGIAGSEMLKVTADGCTFDGVYLTNPNHLANQTGNRTLGINFLANYGRVTGCRIVGQQQAIMVNATGEYHHFTIANNLILDVPGSGDGASNSTSSNGEDRGDGIYCMGAVVTITGNVVTALAGTDARIGIGLESLASYETTGYVHADSMSTITGNVVTGQFRRGIANEGTTHAAITGNTVADSTWYGINVVGTAHYTTVVGNTINWTRLSTDNQGSAWNPIRCGVMVYDNVTGCLISGNIIEAATNSVLPTGIATQVGSGGNSVDLTIQNNHILGNSNQIGNGIAISNGATATRILGNRINGFSSNGINLSAADGVEVVGNRITGSSGTTGIVTSGNSTYARVDQNIIRLCTTAIQAYFRSVWLTVSGNTIDQASTGIDLYGTAAGTTVQMSNNLFSTVTTKTTNIPSSGVTSVGNN